MRNILIGVTVVVVLAVGGVLFANMQAASAFAAKLQECYGDDATWSAVSANVLTGSATVSGIASKDQVDGKPSATIGSATIAIRDLNAPKQIDSFELRDITAIGPDLDLTIARVSGAGIDLSKWEGLKSCSEEPEGKPTFTMASVEVVDVHQRRSGRDGPAFKVGSFAARGVTMETGIPLAGSLEMKGLEVTADDAAKAGNPRDAAQSKPLFDALGGKVVADGRIEIAFDKSDGKLDIKDMQVKLQNGPSLTANGSLIGLQPDPKSGRADLAFNPAAAKFAGAKLVYVDSGFSAKIMEAIAKRQGTTVDALKGQQKAAFAMLRAQFGRQSQRIGTILDALDRHIEKPGTLTIEAAPQQPRPFAALAVGAMLSPAGLADSLNVTVKAE